MAQARKIKWAESAPTLNFPRGQRLHFLRLDFAKRHLLWEARNQKAHPFSGVHCANLGTRE